MKPKSQADLVREYAQRTRVFARSELIAELGDTAAGALGQMVGAEIVRHAIGVYSLRGILSSDQRVQDKIAQTSARPLTQANRESDARKAEEHAAATLNAKMQTGETLVERVLNHFESNPIASASDLKRLYGQGASTAAKTLETRDKLAKVRDGLWIRPGIDPFGPEMSAYVEANSIELASVRREMEQIAGITAMMDQGPASIEWVVARPQGRGTQVIMTMTGVPAIWAQSRNGKLNWYSLKGVVSPVAATHIARMVLNPMPERMSDLVNLIESGKAPTGMRRRHGGYREYTPSNDTSQKASVDQANDSRPYATGYGPLDTHVLDPRKLGNGLPEEVILEIDDREDDRLVTMLTDVPNLHILRTHLEMADFVARKGQSVLGIERKTGSDLSASLHDNRLVEQVHRMSSSGMPCCFIIEGGMTGIRTQPLPRLASMQTRLNFGVNIRVLETIDMAHTAYVIVTAIRDHFFGSGTAFDLKPIKIPNLGNLERALYMLQTIPGISPTRAAALIEKFGTISAISQASVKEIATVEGIGSKTAKALHDVLHAK